MTLPPFFYIIYFMLNFRHFLWIIILKINSRIAVIDSINNCVIFKSKIILIYISLNKKKYLAQEVRQKRDISDRWSKVEGGLLCSQHSHWVTVQLSGVVLHQKWVLPFSSEIRCWIFFYSIIFSKKAVFSEKTVLGTHLTIF